VDSGKTSKPSTTRALENGVDPELDMKTGSTTKKMGTVKPGDVAAAQYCLSYRLT
jgi:hypothetical protein